MLRRVPQSTNYWREVNKLDRKLYDIAEPAGHEIIGIVKVRHFHTAWGAETQNLPTYWRGRRLPNGMRAVAQLALGELVDTDAFTTGLYADIYKYSTLPFIRVLHVTPGMIVNIDDYKPDEMQDSAAQKLSNRIGADAVTSEHYDMLLAQLRRGASGDYAIPFLAPPEE